MADLKAHEVGTLHVRKSKTNKRPPRHPDAEGIAFFAQLAAGRLDATLLRREWKKANQSEPMKAACKRAKIEPAIGFHQLRHTWAIASGDERHADLLVVAKQLRP